MKKNVLLISLCALSLSVSAQFKVQSDGNIAIQTTSTALSPISINSAGSSSTYINCSSTGKSGLTLTAYGSNSSGTIYGGLYTSTSANQAIGLRGNASYGDTSIGAHRGSDPL